MPRISISSLRIYAVCTGFYSTSWASDKNARRPRYAVYIDFLRHLYSKCRKYRCADLFSRDWWKREPRSKYRGRWILLNSAYKILEFKHSIENLLFCHPFRPYMQKTSATAPVFSIFGAKMSRKNTREIARYRNLGRAGTFGASLRAKKYYNHHKRRVRLVIFAKTNISSYYFFQHTDFEGDMNITETRRPQSTDEIDNFDDDPFFTPFTTHPRYLK